MNSEKLNQIVAKVNELLNGANDAFNESAGYTILTDDYPTKRVITITQSLSLTESNFFEIEAFKINGGFSVTRQGLNEDQVIELLNK